MEFLNKTLHAYFAQEGIEHQTSTARTPEQNGVVERRNHTLVEVVRTMISATKVPLFFWAEAIATTYGENLDKKKEKGNARLFVGYSTLLKSYRVYNKRTRVRVETIHVNFDELPQMASDHFKPCTTTSTKVPTADMIVTMSMIELESLFGPLFDEYFNGENQVVSKSSAVTITDASDKRQEQPDSTSSATTLTTTISTDGNFDL
ncbi:gag-pol polyprotein [Tanacetum coccineum]